MTLQRQVLIWAISLAVLVFFLWVFSSILLPFIAGWCWPIFSIPWRTSWSGSACRGSRRR